MIIHSIMVLNTVQVIREGTAELKQRVVTREENDRRIAELRILLKSMVRFLPKESDREILLREIEAAKRKAPALPEAIFHVLEGSEAPMTSAQIREALEQSGFEGILSAVGGNNDGVEQTGRAEKSDKGIHLSQNRGYPHGARLDL
jgi:hypothetical protein